MRVYDSDLWVSDLDEALTVVPELGELAGRSVMITGATGLICSAVADMLIRWNETHGDKIRVLAAGRDRKKAAARFSCLDKVDWFRFVPYDATAADNHLADPCDFIIHGAGNATPGMIVREPVETMLSAVFGTKYLLDFAERSGAERFLFLSSSEVYGAKAGTQPYKAADYGYVDLLNPRNAYSTGKRAAETLCVSYLQEYGVDSVIVRPGHIYGPTAAETDNRVSSAWAYDAARGKDVVMKSDGRQLRSYCYCADCASAILKVLLRGEKGRAYNVSNPDSIIDIRGMAEVLTRAAGVKLRMELPTEEEKKGFNPMSNSSLDSAELLALGWKGMFNAQRGFAHTVTILRELTGR